jgi:hypothetical protein
MACTALRNIRSRFFARYCFQRGTIIPQVVTDESGWHKIVRTVIFRQKEKRTMLLQILDIFCGLLWTIVVNIVSFAWSVYITLTGLLALLWLPVYIKVYLLPGDTSTTNKTRYFCVQFHAVLLSVAFITQQCQLLQLYSLDKHSTNVIVTSDCCHLSTNILFSDTRGTVSPYVSCQSEDPVFSFVR